MKYAETIFVDKIVISSQRVSEKQRSKHGSVRKIFPMEVIGLRSSLKMFLMYVLTLNYSKLLSLGNVTKIRHKKKINMMRKKSIKTKHIIRLRQKVEFIILCCLKEIQRRVRIGF